MGVWRCLLDRTMSTKSVAVRKGGHYCRQRSRSERRNTNSHAVPATMISTSKGPRRKGIFVLLVNRICGLSPGPASREARGKEGSDLFTIPGTRTLFPILQHHYPGSPGRSWLDGQTGRATLWRGVDLSKLDRTENQLTV